MPRTSRRLTGSRRSSATSSPIGKEIVEGEWATNLIQGAWSTDAIRGWCLQLYPFIHAFPKFLAEALIKARMTIRAPS